MPVRFGRVITEAPQHINAHLLFVAKLRMRLEQFQQTRDHVHAPPLNLHVPGLMIDAGADDVDISAGHLLVRGDQSLAPRPKLDAVGDLPMPALHAVA